MKKHNLFKVVMITIALVVLLSWILPGTEFDSQIVEKPISRIGIFELMGYVSIAIQYFSHISIYVLTIGGLYGVLHKIPGYRRLVEKMANGFKNFEIWFLVLFIIIFAVSSAMFGLSLPIMVLFPFVISVILMMGYDKITAALVTAGSTIAGLAGSMLSGNNTYGIDMILGTRPESNMMEKGILLTAVIALLIFNVLMYAKKHKTEEVVADKNLVPETTERKQAFWPIVVILDAVVIVCFLAFTSWNLFEIDIFEQLLERMNKFEIFDIAIFEGLFGLVHDANGSNAFGYWTLVELSVVVMFASWFLSLCYKVKFNDFLTNILNGAKRALKPALLIVLIYVVLVSTTYIPFLLTMLKPIIDSTEGFNAITMSITAFISSIFNVELYYAAGSTLYYVIGGVFTNLAAGEITLLSLIFQSMYGVAMLVAPTSVVLIATLAYMNIPYQNWLKAIWKFLLQLVIVLLIIFALIPML